MDIDAAQTPDRSESRMRWAALTGRVFEVDPLQCAECGGEMKIVAFIEARDQSELIERILKHCGLWHPPGLPRAPETVPTAGAQTAGPKTGRTGRQVPFVCIGLRKML